jgi:signal transduction histidine kinase
MNKAMLRWPLRPRRLGRPLPLRLWLVVAVAAITGAGFLAQMGLTAVIAVWEQQAADARLASVRQALGNDTARWRDAAWQRHADASLAALDVDAAVFAAQPASSGQPGPLVYATPGAQRLLDGEQGTSATVRASATAPSQMTAHVVFQRIVISGAALPASAAAGPPIGVAFLWYLQPALGGFLEVLWPVVELGTFALTLAIVVWLVGQPVLRPLAALSAAAEEIAGGDLEVHLPTSPVREIAEVSAALEGMSGALRDSLAQQAAIEGERRLFIGAVAHDLRTPLFMLRGHLKGLERGVAATPDKVAQYVERCRIQADALDRMIGDLFTYTRLEYLELAPEHLPLELGALLRQAVEGAQPLAAAKVTTLALEAPAMPCPVLGDSQLLARVVENLLDNALRHTPDGGRITVRWGCERGAVAFAVEDTGPGIAAHDLPHLFTPLYRGEASRNRRTGGAGLGLAIAQRIMRAHGGEVTAANRPAGGAVFTGTLPTTSRPIPAISVEADAAMPVIS